MGEVKRDTSLSPDCEPTVSRLDFVYREFRVSQELNLCEADYEMRVALQ